MGSHFNTLTSLMKLFADVLVVLESVKVDGGSLAKHTLSKQLHKKDLEILEATSMVRRTMDALQSLRDMGFASILLKVEIFNTVVDIQLTEYQDRFSETSTQLLEYMDLEGQLEIFYHSCIKDERFTTLKGISELSRLMVSTGKHRSYPLVYKFLMLALILPVATASVEKCFWKMKLLNSDLHNKIGDEFLTDALLCYVETEALVKVKNEKVMEQFQKMYARRGQI
ncbi:uncharacterized protein LOC111885559 [Lactuca sativa]|uniref:uncharacterized protein LOC111885559 n=1 Tax=Lactuca sativa TaxID=4236 RepID=UPI000CD87F4D|nr:uncharacterized protein LOC111885559 [Lactuca sativa]